MQQVYDQNNKQDHGNCENVAHQTLMRFGCAANVRKSDEKYYLCCNCSTRKTNAEYKSIEKEMEKSTDAVFDLKRSLLSSASVGSFT